MAKRKTKTYTLAGFWKNINTVAPKCYNGAKTDRKKSLSDLTKIVDEANASSIPSSIGDLFVKPYLEADKFCVNFTAPTKVPTEEEDNKPVTCEKEDDELANEPVVNIDSLGLFNYIGLFKTACENKDDEEILADFKDKRQNAFMNEISKLPDPYFVYLAVLQEVAYCNDVVSVEDREGNFHKSPSGFYLSLLWAFKEFEAFYLRAQNRSLRADYGIIWHEGEWVQDSKRSRGYV